jgi:hypothetical protein
LCVWLGIFVIVSVDTYKAASALHGTTHATEDAWSLAE